MDAILYGSQYRENNELCDGLKKKNSRQKGRKLTEKIDLKTATL
jgi:hypothetical protein